MTSTRLALATLVPFALASTLAVPAAGARPRPPRWQKINITVTCDDKDPSICRGAYGLTVAADGSYTVGPDPAGAVINDNLSPEELKQIAKNAELLSRTSSRAKVKCDKRAALPGGGQTVTLTTADGKDLTLFQWSVAGKGSRCTVGNRARVIELETGLGLLLALHYPLPFGASGAAAPSED
jgi:hypothetical protein